MTDNTIRQINKIRSRVLLINPPYYRLFKNSYTYNKYPLSLAYLAGAINKETDWTTKIYNADFAIPSESLKLKYLAGEGFTQFRTNLHTLAHPVWMQFINVLIKFKPKVVGIYCCATNSSSVQIIANIIKNYNRQIIVILGGPHPTSIGKDAFSNTNVDIIVKGEGEQTIVELLKKIENTEQLDTVKGIIYRTGNEIIETANREPIRDLDSLCFPSKYAKEILIDYEKYPISAFNDIIATRGCPYNCFFCGSRSVFSRKTRFRTPENVTNELKYLQKMGLTSFEFLDDCFGVNQTYLSEICNSFIDNCPRIQWTCETRANLINEETVKLMKKAGCREITIGVESGNNEILREIRKEISVEDAISAMDIITKNGINLRANFILGTPKETEQTLNDTYNCMKRVNGVIGYSIFTPYPGTEAFEYCKKVSLIKNNYDSSLYNHQSPENCFCINIDKQRFREIALEIERYVDEKNMNQEFKQVFSYKIIGRLLSSGAFRNNDSLRSLMGNTFTQLKIILRNRN